MNNFHDKFFVRNQRLIHDSLHKLLTINVICRACWAFMLNTFFMCLLDQIYFVRYTLNVLHSTMLIVWSLFYLFHFTICYWAWREFLFSLGFWGIRKTCSLRLIWKSMRYDELLQGIDGNTTIYDQTNCVVQQHKIK